MTRGDDFTASMPVLIGQFPPPLHGASIISEWLARRLEESGHPAKTIDVSSGRLTGLCHHIVRVQRVLSAIFWLIARRPRFTQLNILLAVDGGWGLVYNIAVVMIARMVRANLILYFHSANQIVHSSVLMRLMLRIAGAQGIYAMCSLQMASMLRKRYGVHNPVIIISNAAWIEQRDHTICALRQSVTFGHLSVLCREKGLVWAIATLKKALESGLDARLILAGIPFEPEAEQILQNGLRELPGRLIWRGAISGREKENFYREIDCFLFPSEYRHETQSLVVPEALSFGVPVIAFDHRFVRELILPDGGIVLPLQSRFDEQAVDWIKNDLSCETVKIRRRNAAAQFSRMKTEADGQIEGLIETLIGNDV